MTAQEHCGVFGIYGHPDAARITFFGLYALQHRGQESCGIVAGDGTRVSMHRGLGLVPEVFNPAVLDELPGHLAIGHVRYSTTGSTMLINAQPFVVLIATPLKGADGQVYALAQGNLIVGGAGASAAGSKVQINHLSAGRVPEGATVERAVPTPLNQGEFLQLDLNANDFGTAREVARAINAKMGEGIAQALDGRVIRVRMPASPDARVAFMADIENLADRARRAGRARGHQRTHRLDRRQPVGHAVGLRGGARQPVGDHQHHAGGQPAGAAVGRPDGGAREGRHHHQPGRPAR